MPPADSSLLRIDGLEVQMDVGRRASAQPDISQVLAAIAAMRTSIHGDISNVRSEMSDLRSRVTLMEGDEEELEEFSTKSTSAPLA